jgi:hypothetical protein
MNRVARANLGVDRTGGDSSAELCDRRIAEVAGKPNTTRIQHIGHGCEDFALAVADLADGFDQLEKRDRLGLVARVGLDLVNHRMMIDRNRDAGLAHARSPLRALMIGVSD